MTGHPDRLALLLDGKGGQEDRHQSVLAEGYPELRRLGRLLPVLPDQLNPLRLFELLFGYDQVWAGPAEYGSGGLKTRVVELRQNDHLVTRSGRVVKASFGGSK